MIWGLLVASMRYLVSDRLAGNWESSYPMIFVNDIGSPSPPPDVRTSANKISLLNRSWGSKTCSFPACYLTLSLAMVIT